MCVHACMHARVCVYLPLMVPALVLHIRVYWTTRDDYNHCSNNFENENDNCTKRLYIHTARHP